MLVFRISNQTIFGLEFVVVIFLGAQAVIDAALSVGMLLAFLSYRTQFTTRFTALIDKFYELQILKLHAARLADIVLADPEIDERRWQNSVGSVTPSVELKNVCYAYSPDSKKVVSNFSMSVAPGETIALVGPSGCGKTTLLKLIVGLIKPDSGDVMVGGISIRKIGLKSYREMIGVVMQEDRLFAGSVSDNISFFDSASDDSWVRECAKVASVYDEISAMPMGFHTFIGDMGSALSAGQRQRIMLARALYRRPKLLFLDEATSHLDVGNERAVSAAVRALNVTTIIVAHRPETIGSADRVLDLSLLHSPE